MNQVSFSGGGGLVNAAESAGFCIEISQDVPKKSFSDARLLLKQVRAAVQCCGLKAGALNLVIVGDERMGQLHEQFSGVPGTTDVLTFDLRESETDAIEGEIYICLDEARRRADEFKHPVSHELVLYAVHGLLHLLGYDDHSPKDHRRMHAEEDRILETIGVGRVFARAGEPGP